jgi:hypothetical protein
MEVVGFVMLHNGEHLEEKLFELETLPKLIIAWSLFFQHGGCRNPSFGLATKAKGLQGCKAKRSPGVKARGSPGVTSHTPRSLRKCEGV